MLCSAALEYSGYRSECDESLQAILEKVRIFVKEMSSGGPAAQSKGGFSADQPKTNKVDLHATPVQKPEPKVKEKPKPHAGGKRTFESTEKFYARAKDIYACFTDAKCISAYTQSPAKVTSCRSKNPIAFLVAAMICMNFQTPFI